MKFIYSYKTSDGVRHEGVYRAATKEAVYDGLRAKGIKAFGVTMAPGALNALLGAWKWWGGALAVCAVAATAAYLGGNVAPQGQDDGVFLSRTRRYPIGDSAVIEAGIKSGWSGIFQFEGERFLASFAVPGVPAGVRTTSGKELAEALERHIEPSPGDPIEAVQIKSMVEGMKEELRRYIAAGGTYAKYGERLVERQEREMEYRRRIKDEIDALSKDGASEDRIEERWKAGNAELRNMGVRLVPLPETEAETDVR